MAFFWDHTQSQGDVTGKQFLFDVPVTHTEIVAPGDVATQNGTASADGTPQVDTTVNLGTTLITGIVSAVTPTFAGEALSNTGLAALTAGSVLVNVDPSALYNVDVVGGTLAVTDVGFNFDFDNTAATTSGGLSISNMALDAGTAGTNVATRPFQVVRLLEDAAGVLGNRALVRVNASNILPGATGL